MAITQNELEDLIKKYFPESTFIVTDLVGDEDHYMLEIKDMSFVGKSLIEQHKMVNQALKDCLGGQLHALKIKTIAPVS